MVYVEVLKILQNVTHHHVTGVQNDAKLIPSSWTERYENRE